MVLKTHFFLGAYSKLWFRSLHARHAAGLNFRGGARGHEMPSNGFNDSCHSCNSTGFRAGIPWAELPQPRGFQPHAVLLCPWRSSICDFEVDPHFVTRCRRSGNASKTERICSSGNQEKFLLPSVAAVRTKLPAVMRALELSRSYALHLSAAYTKSGTD